MFAWLFNKFKIALSKNNKNSDPERPKNDLSREIEQNLSQICEIFSQSSDLVIRRFTIDGENKRQAAIVYIDGLTDKAVINDHILRPLMSETIKLETNDKISNSEKDLQWIEENLITVNELSRNATLEQVIDAILTGDTVLLVQGFTEALQLNSKGWANRSIEESQMEVVVKGARDSFIEDLRTNTALLRRKIGNSNLTFEAMSIGRKTKTAINIAYIAGVARVELIKEVCQRLKRIETDSILSSEAISEFIEDAPVSLFATTAYTERPDVVAAKLLEGRVAIIVDGSPIVYTVPALFFESFQSPEDYHMRPYYASVIRWVRIMSFLITILLPALYIALTTYHQELIPTPLLITISAATDSTPFPTVIEVIGMGLVFEVLREAGIRMPRPFGSSVSIVGGLVIGEAVVGAGLIGEPTVIVIALTAITSYVVPFQAEVGVLLRFGFAIIAGIFGLYGVSQGLILLLIYLASLRSFGVPYFSPFAPFLASDQKDVIIRAPIWAMLKRPRSLEPQDEIRQKPDLRPKPPGNGED